MVDGLDIDFKIFFKTEGWEYLNTKSFGKILLNYIVYKASRSLSGITASFLNGLIHFHITLLSPLVTDIAVVSISSQ